MSIMPNEPLPGTSRRRLIQSSFLLFGVPPCCTTRQVQPEDVSYRGDTLVLKLGRSAGLDKVGTATAVVDAARKLNIIVARTGRDQYAAINRTCTHGGAQCTYNHSRRTLQCTSLNHAEYDLSGKLLHGRTHGDLRTYPVRRTGATLEIQLDGKA